MSRQPDRRRSQLKLRTSFPDDRESARGRYKHLTAHQVAKLWHWANRAPV